MNSLDPKPRKTPLIGMKRTPFRPQSGSSLQSNPCAVHIKANGELDKGDNVQVIATQRDGERVAIEIVAESPAPNPKRK